MPRLGMLDHGKLLLIGERTASLDHEKPGPHRIWDEAKVFMTSSLNSERLFGVDLARKTNTVSFLRASCFSAQNFVYIHLLALTTLVRGSGVTCETTRTLQSLLICPTACFRCKI